MVHVAMILEWFADVQINHRLVPLLSAKAEAEGGTSSASSSRRQGKRSPLIPKRIPAIERYATYLPQIGITLPPALLADVRQVITWQNVIVHEDPEPDSVTPDEACNAVETGMAVIEHALSCLRQRTGSSPWGQHHSMRSTSRLPLTIRRNIGVIANLELTAAEILGLVKVLDEINRIRFGGSRTAAGRRIAAKHVPVSRRGGEVPVSGTGVATPSDSGQARRMKAGSGAPSSSELGLGGVDGSG
jgi:hypothetical protein